MTKKYEYLEKYITKNWPKKRVIQLGENAFHETFESEIEEAEKRIQFEFPKALKEFWLEIGCGRMQASEPSVRKTRGHWANEILEPKLVADLILGEGESGSMEDSSTREDFEDIPNIIPFFYLGNFSFLYMLPDSDAVHYLYDPSKPIEEHFEDFIWKMYHIDPVYFLNLPPEDK